MVTSRCTMLLDAPQRRQYCSNFTASHFVSGSHWLLEPMSQLHLRYYSFSGLTSCSSSASRSSSDYCYYSSSRTMIDVVLFSGCASRSFDEAQINWDNMPVTDIQMHTSNHILRGDSPCQTVRLNKCTIKHIKKIILDQKNPAKRGKGNCVIVRQAASWPLSPHIYRPRRACYLAVVLAFPFPPREQLFAAATRCYIPLRYIHSRNRLVAAKIHNFPLDAPPCYKSHLLN